MTALLEVQDLRRRFGGIVAVDGCSLTVEEGSITGLIGPNGSGKTTVFNLVTGYFRPDQGRVRFSGHDVTGLRPHRLCHRGLSRTFQITRLFHEMTVLENMIVPVPHVGLRPLFAPGVRRDEQGRATGLLTKFGLSHLAGAPAGTLSFGQQKLLEMAAVLMSEPRLVLLDEPAGGVNPTMIRFMMDVVRSLNREHGVTFLIVEHNMPVVMELCDRVLVMDAGKLVAQGTPQEVRADPAVLDAYLGR